MATAVIETIEQATFTEATARPTPEQIDELAQRYLLRLSELRQARDFVADAEERLIKLVQAYGTVPPNAEKSRRLHGVKAELTVTKSDTLTINDDRVEVLKEALDANGRGDFFTRLFTLRSKYEVVDGAESALKSEALPKRLAEKVLNLWGRCISVKAKKPSLKVTIADPAKPAKKSRAKKGTK